MAAATPFLRSPMALPDEILLAVVFTAIVVLWWPASRKRKILIAKPWSHRFQYLFFYIPAVVGWAILCWAIIIRLTGHTGTDVLIPVLTGAVLWASALASLYVVPVWRHTITTFDRPPPGLPWSETRWRGAVRAYPSVTGTAWLLGLTLVALMVAPRGAAGDGAVYSLAGATLVGVFITLTVIYFNWPKLVVPPHLRRDSGAIREWLRRGIKRSGAI